MIDKLPPHSHEAEQGVLGCCLLDSRRALQEAQSSIRNVETFYDMRHQTIWSTLCRMSDEMGAIDLITIQQWLKDQGKLEAIGGITYLAELMDATPSAANLSYYLEILIEKQQLREMVRACTETVAKIYANGTPANEIVDGAEQSILAVRQGFSRAGNVKSLREVMPETLAQMEAMFAAQGTPTGIPTGFVDVDKMTSGLQDSEMTVVAAFPSVGKTSWAMNVAEHVAIDQGVPVGVFSVEMSAKSILTRLLCSRARVNLRNVRGGFLVDRDFPKLTGSANRMLKAPMFFVEQSDLTISQVRAIARRMQREHGIKLFIVDYLQLLRAGGKENKTQETAAISSGLKQMAKELNVHVMACSQLTKGNDGSIRCRNAAEIHQDADNLFILTTKGEEREEQHSDCRRVELMIEKQRNGPTGPVYLTFLRSITRFESAAKISDEDAGVIPQGTLPYRD